MTYQAVIVPLVLVPDRLRETCARDSASREWLEGLPALIEELISEWRLALESVLDHDGCASWIGDVTTADGTLAILKIGLPHFEAEHEIDALELLNGDPTVLLLEADRGRNAMLLERCEPSGTPFDLEPAAHHEVILAGLLRRFWRTPAEPHPFRTLAEMTAVWSVETLEMRHRWTDPGLVRDGLALFEELPRTAPRHVLLHTDMHVKNVLRATREPWLVIDPKPFVGDPAYDASQHLLRICKERGRPEGDDTITRYADLLEVEAERVRLWVFARAAAEADHIDTLIEVARALAP